MDSVWAGIYEFCRDTIQDIIPSARVGYEGSDHYVSTWKADDHWKLSRVMDLNNIYFYPFEAAVARSFLPRDALFGAGWFGGYPWNRSAPFMKYSPWALLFKGANSYWIFHAGPAEDSIMAPDHSIYPFFKVGLREFNEIKEGIGKSLILSERQNDLGILFSPSSVHTSTFFGSPLGKKSEFLEGSTQIFIDMGFQPRIISYAELKEGKLSGYGLPLLYLPYCLSLSLAEIEAIKDFVKNGGLLMADLRPGVRDEHGKLFPAGQLDDLFGVKTGPEESLKTGELKVTGMRPPFRGNLPNLLYDPSLKARGGKSLGKIGNTPAIVVNRYGGGKTILLNSVFPEYYEKTEFGNTPDSAEERKDFIFRSKRDFGFWGKTASFRAFFKKLLKEQEFLPPVVIKPELPKLEVTRFKSGKIQYVGILQGLPRPGLAYAVDRVPLPPSKSVKITFPQQGHVYDVRTKKYAGRVRRIKTNIHPCEAKLYALLPYQVKGVNISLTNSTFSQGSAVPYEVALSASADKPESHIFRIRVINPRGEEVPYYSRNLAVKGKAADKIFFAMNEEPGTWKIEIQEVISAKKSQAEFEIKQMRDQK